MLRKLTVSNLAIVEKAEVEFDPGLTVITGETGSGKSVLMGALELVLGARADSDVVRDGAKEAEVEAEFDDGMVLRRAVTASGRTRSWVNDESVALAELKEVGQRLVDIHGPRANQSLLEESFQRDQLDGYKNVAKASQPYAEAYAKAAKIRDEIARLEESATGDIEGEMDLLRYQVDELKAADLTQDDETLADRHAAQAHAEEVIEEANSITEALGGDQGVADLLIRLQPHFTSLKKRLGQAEAWAGEADEITMRVQELSRTIADAVSRMDAGEVSLAELDARLTIVSRLKRKYKVAMVSELMELLEKKSARLSDLEGRGEKLAALERERIAAEAEVLSRGVELTRQRKIVADRLSREVTAVLRDLGFLQAKFSIDLEPAPPQSHGCDKVTYLFEPNPGESARPLSAIASSGEIARVMLALKVVLPGGGATAGIGTFVFDEIDANIGGEVGRIVGAKMREVAARRQVIAITHLPQCAAFGQRHLVVSKAVSCGRTRTHVRTVSGEDRVGEIARMLGGAGKSDVAKLHARELLKSGE